MTKHPNQNDEIPLDPDEEQEVRKREALRSPVIYEIIRREGEEELERPAFSLAISGFAAGLAIGFSVVSEAILKAHLPDAAWGHLVENFGYSVGFLLIIMARLQLFTENTITPVLPVFLKPTLSSVAKTARLWAVVLAANMLGCLIFAVALSAPGAITPLVFEAAMSISHHMMENSWWEMLVRGIFSGWLIAMLVWMMPTAGAAKFWLIVLVTYLIAAGDFTHIIAGSVEAFLLVLHGQIALTSMFVDFIFPVLIGNVIGGTLLFAIFSYGQVSQEI